jgi:hypothetical protein
MPIIVGYNINLGNVRTLTRIVEPKQIVFYADEDGNEPFQVWLDALRDTQGRRRILKRLFRFNRGTTEMSNQSGMDFLNCACSSVLDIDCILVKIQATLSLSYVVETRTAKTVI